MAGRPIRIREITVEELRRILDDENSVLGRAKAHHVVMDLGASNCRIGIVAKGDEGIHEICFITFPSRSIKDILKGMDNFISELGTKRLSKIVAASANVPCPVNGLVGGPMANLIAKRMEDRFLDLRKMPSILFPRGKSVLLNDLEAGSYGIVATSEFKTFPHHFRMMWPATGPLAATPYENSLGEGNAVVIAPGTGLGIAAIQWHSFEKRYTIFPLEFGHTSYIGNTRDQKFATEYAKELARNDFPLEFDDVCSGRGLERAYKFVSNGNSLKASEIGKKAASGETTAVQAMKLYNRCNMYIASQLTMGFQPRTVIICGDNTIKNKKFYDNPENVEEMRKEFLNHSMERFGFMSKAHVVRQVHPTNLNILGCAYVCEKMKVNGNSKL